MNNFLKYTSLILTIIGALNWGLVGAFRFDLVGYLFGEMSMLSRIIYIIIGVSAVIAAISVYNCRREHNRDEY